MILPLILYRSLRQHALPSLVAIASIALASGLLMAVWAVKEQAQESFVNTTTTFDAVLGARGSKLQLVLNSIFHLEASPGNLPESDYLMIKRHPAVKTAIPIAVGDNYHGWRIVGTIDELFTGVDLGQGRHYVLEPGGRLFAADRKEAVVGAFAAKRTGLKVGDTFHPFHGLVFDPRQQHADLYTVTGILGTTNTPADRVIWIPLEGLQTMSGHDPRLAHDVSAVLIQLRAPSAGFLLDLMYNRQGDRLTFAYPVGAIIADFFSKIDWFDRVLALVAYLVAVVAAASVLAGIYASMSARRRDLAILRALGARRRTVFGAVLAEAAFIGALGSAAGYAVYAVLFAGVAAVIRSQTGVVLTLGAWHSILWAGPVGMILLCSIGGLVPAFKAYRLPVAETLAPTS
jgi:putative ABC transport system permease protein